MKLSDNCLDPAWITGFADGDGCFYVDQKNKTGSFIVSQNKRSKNALNAMRAYFGCGNVQNGNIEQNMMEFKVKVNDDLIKTIFPHFAKYPPQTKKRFDLQKLSDFIFSLENKENPYNFIGESDLYKDINWLAGFVESDGSFTLSVSQEKIQPQLVIKQYISEKLLIQKLVDHYPMANLKIEKRDNKERYVTFRISNQSGLVKIISVFFTVNNGQGFITAKRYSMFYFSVCLNLWAKYVFQYSQARSPRNEQKLLDAKSYKVNYVIPTILKIKTLKLNNYKKFEKNLL